MLYPPWTYVWHRLFIYGVLSFMDKIIYIFTSFAFSIYIEKNSLTRLWVSAQGTMITLKGISLQTRAYWHLRFLINMLSE